MNCRLIFCYNQFWIFSKGCADLSRHYIPVIGAALLMIPLFGGCSVVRDNNATETTLETLVTIESIDETEDTVPTETPTPTFTPTPTPEPQRILCSFIGDCTLAEALAWNGSSAGFDAVVNGDYEYCFQNAVEYLSQDDLTLANFEGTLTDATNHLVKEFVFGSPAEYAEMLVNGSIEAVNLSNNHSYDYLQEGLDDTRENLEDYGILWSDKTQYAVSEIRGIKIGMCGVDLVSGDSVSEIYPLIDSMKEEGCNIIIVSCHWGTERMYSPESSQVSAAQALIDYGVDIVVGTHPHRLQPIELYNGKYILYSLSNFCFGGNTGLSDPDSCIVQCEFVMDETNSYVEEYKLNVIPFSQTSFTSNDYCPRPYEWGSDDYYRVMDKLGWTQEDE